MYSLNPVCVFVLFIGILRSCSAQSTVACSNCTYYTLAFTGTGSALQRGDDTLGGIIRTRGVLEDFFTVVSGTVACATYPDQACSPNAICTPGGDGTEYYECECNADGFVETRADTYYTCEDVDECIDPGLNNCHSDATCINEPGTYVCLCNDGFTGNGTLCFDIDECESGLHDCSDVSSCQNTEGSFDCLCTATGYTWDGSECVDIDECAQEGTCGDNMSCANTNGSHICTCSDGFQSAADGSCIDIDECEDGTAECPISSEGYCENTFGGFVCGCNDGYTGDGISCTDINECLIDGFCDNGDCSNTDGSFLCSCSDGYQLNENTCEDINECEESDACAEHEECENSEGGFSCNCVEGYVKDESLSVCVDLDECEAGTANCDEERGMCHNIPGSFECSCKEGYTGDGIMCEDLNECEFIMCENANCTNTDGSYDCECNDGFRLNAEGLCEDVDECLEDTHSCDISVGHCINIMGSFECGCGDGFRINEFECIDIDECVEHSMLCDDGKCVNTAGSYKCECNDGFRLDATGACLDVDECEEMLHTCEVSVSHCINMPGSYECECSDGYKNGESGCEDIDECDESPCHDYADCVNEVGSFKCACRSGYVGDGFQCDTFDMAEWLENIAQERIKIWTKNFDARRLVQNNIKMKSYQRAKQRRQFFLDGTPGFTPPC